MIDLLCEVTKNVAARCRYVQTGACLCCRRQRRCASTSRASRWTITGLTLSLPAIKTCVAETVTVNGTGQCATFSVNFGDGQKLLVLRPPANPIKFPATFHHTYSKLGTYKVEADGGSTCPGVASETVQVAGRPLDLV
jgi:hypothetical protein